uniref:Glycine--tRNA ligase, mitochondrial 1-like n=1 Tax=Piliocolobus tephrosceles TaxID=591936 RepID=A0A8C9H1A1_9PRIM
MTILTIFVVLYMFFLNKTHSCIGSIIRTRQLKLKPITTLKTSTVNFRNTAYIRHINSFDIKKNRINNIHTNTNKNNNNNNNNNKEKKYILLSRNSTRNKNGDSGTNTNNISQKMDTKKNITLEKEIEKYIHEISSLIERNESIKELEDVETKKEIEENKKIIKQKKQQLKELCSTPSETLKLVENRLNLESLVKRRLFYMNAFEIYGGVSGLYDFGPSGCLLKSELENMWRYHFIFYDEMLEIKSTCITPYNVLKTSGHVDRFTDLMVRDIITKDCYRADKYLSEWLTNKLETIKKKKNSNSNSNNNNNNNNQLKKEDTTDVQTCKNNKLKDNDNKDLIYDEIAKINLILKRIDGLGEDEMKTIIKEYNIKSPENNPLSDPFPFNLMFQTKIGPKNISDKLSTCTESSEKDVTEDGVSEKSTTTTGTNFTKDDKSDKTHDALPKLRRTDIVFLRPETAQGIFVNFRKLLEYNGGKMPFAGAQIGLGFRNEISPRNGLLRVREFEMAEIEYFVNPDKKTHDKFYLYKHLMLPLYPRNNQTTVDGSVIKNITLEEAVERKIIGNEVLAYFLGRTYIFLLKCGI